MTLLFRFCRPINPQNSKQIPAIAALTGTYSAKCSACVFLLYPNSCGTHNALYLRIKMRKEVRMAEQYPVKKADVVQLHDVKHRQKPTKNLQNPNPFCTRPMQRERPPRRTAKSQAARRTSRAAAPRGTVLSSGAGTASNTSFGAEPKNRFSWISPTPAYSSRKYAAMSIPAASAVMLILSPPQSFCFFNIFTSRRHRRRARRSCIAAVKSV